jgi:hypothetical protein
VKGTQIEDRSFPEEDGKVLTREIKVNGQKQANLYCRLAEGKDIAAVSDGMYSVNNKSFYVKVDAGAKPVIRDSGNGKELLVPIEGNSTGVKYSIIW